MTDGSGGLRTVGEGQSRVWDVMPGPVRVALRTEAGLFAGTIANVNPRQVEVDLSNVLL